MKNISILKHKNNGFSLIEILVAVVISAIGLLSLGVFQSNLLKTSAESKARIEGGVVCQAQMEKLREYTFAVDGTESKLTNDSWFNPDFDTTTTMADGNKTTTYSGNNADYLITRTATVLVGTEIAADGTVTDVSGTNVTALDIDETNAIKEINLNLLCSWTDSNNSAQSITLDSIITFNEPSSVAIYNVRKIENDIPAPTGRAHLGEGTIDTDAEGVSSEQEHNDGTKTYKNEKDIVLVDEIDEDSGVANIVLTLERACETDNGICTDFVEIHGRIYRNISSDIKNKFDTTLLFDNLFIKASDAAYCKKWTTSQNVDKSYNSIDVDINGDEEIDYDYMNYTCYLGGGWYGNIGLLIGGYDGIKTDYKMCMGDPNYADKDGYFSGDDSEDQKVREEYKYTKPSLAVRRAYRGMKYKLIEDGDSWVPELDGDGNTIYYSVGIKDATKIYNQDFVLIENNTLDATDCFEVADDVRPLIRSDSENYRYPVGGVASPNPNPKQGLLFANNPGDFVCLNNYIDFDKSGNGYLATATTEDGITTYSKVTYPIQFDGSLRAAYAKGITGITDFEDISDDIFDYEQLYATLIFPFYYISGFTATELLARNVDLDSDGDVNFKDVNMTRDYAGMLPPPLDLHMGNINDLTILSSTLIDGTFNPLAYLAENTVTSARDGYKYRADTECPYDPTHPTTTYDIPGTVTLLADIALDNILINSSTTESCATDATDAPPSFLCKVYAPILPDTSGNLVAQDWTGTVNAYVLDGAGVIDDNYTCSPSPTSVSVNDAGVTGDTVITCGVSVIVSGDITMHTEETLDLAATPVTLTNGECVVTDMGLVSDKQMYHYTCNTSPTSSILGWNNDLTITPVTTKGRACYTESIPNVVTNYAVTELFKTNKVEVSTYTLSVPDSAISVNIDMDVNIDASIIKIANDNDANCPSVIPTP